ncbi:Na+/H+ antiporter subunit G [bacterium]|nr:Na+/H+ antiporter subunit G [bacterium]
MALAGSLLTLAGSLLLFLGALGVLRMPDVYNRMQAGTKATTLGTILFLTGIGIGRLPEPCIFRVLILILFIILTNPVSSHALARAAHRAGIRLTEGSVKDDLDTHA